MGHVMEHVALEVQNLAGAEVIRGKTRGTGERGVYNVTFQFDQEDVGLAAGQLALRLLNHLIYQTEPGVRLPGGTRAVIKIAERLAYGPSTGRHRPGSAAPGHPGDPARSPPLARPAWAWHAPAADLGDRDLGNRQHRGRGGQATRNSPIACCTRSASRCPAPRRSRPSTRPIRAARRIRYPVVLKPGDGNHGRGVCINLTSDDEVTEFFPVASAKAAPARSSSRASSPGKDYRILVVNNEVIAVAERVPAHVVGDGIHTVRAVDRPSPTAIPGVAWGTRRS